MAVTHTKVSLAADTGDSSKVRPSDWNAAHDVTSPLTIGAAADAADEGDIRLPTDSSIMAERNPAGTDYGARFSGTGLITIGQSAREDFRFSCDPNSDLTFRCGQQVSGADDPLGYYDLWVHESVSASYVGSDHQFGFRGTHIRYDSTGTHGGVHGTAGCGGTARGTHIGVQGEVGYDSSGPDAEMYGFLATCQVGNLSGTANGTVTHLAGYVVEPGGIDSSYTVTDYIGVWVQALSSAGSSTVNKYGMKIENISGATGVNEAIHTGTGKVSIGDVLQLAGGVAIGSLPSGVVGMVQRVTDALVPVIGNTVAAGGAAAALVWYNGANWTVIGK